MRTLLVVIALAGVSIFSFGQIARAQVGGTGIPETSPVGVIPEGEPEPQTSDAELKLVGSDCDINEAEASLLRTKGILAVDVEAIKDHLVVGYDPTKVNPHQMVTAIGARMAGTDLIGRHMGGKKAKARGCFAQIVR